jgi:hypothetical protein
MARLGDASLPPEHRVTPPTCAIAWAAVSEEDGLKA